MTRHPFPVDRALGARFCRLDPALGEFSVRDVRLPDDVPTIHNWVSLEYAQYWGLRHKTEDEVHEVYVEITQSSGYEVLLGLYQGRPAFLVETYHPACSDLAAYYQAEPSDRGMHLLVAPPVEKIRGFTRAIFRTVCEFLFADPAAHRIVVEPDSRNRKIRALNRRFGFEERDRVELPATPSVPAKTAVLSFCTRASFAASLRDAGTYERAR